MARKGLGGRALWLGQARGPSAVARTADRGPRTVARTGWGGRALRLGQAR